MYVLVFALEQVSQIWRVSNGVQRNTDYVWTFESVN